MKYFLIKLLGFIFVLIILFTVVVIILGMQSNVHTDYLKAMTQKHSRIDSINKPMIILAGGSNTAFGMDSEKLEKEFSVPVVNLAIHAGFGLNFILEEIKHTVKSKDIVFISIEYFLDNEGAYELKRNANLYYPEASKYYDFEMDKEINLIFDRTRSKLKNIIKNNKLTGDTTIKENLYSSSAFNNYGDFVAHLNLPPIEVLNDKTNFKYIYWSGIDNLNKLNQYAKSKNVTIYYIFPNYPLSEFEKNKDVLNRHFDDLYNNLDMEILNKPLDFIYEDKYFFNTVYHLNKIGRDKRTKQLVEFIKNSPDVYDKVKAIANYNKSK